jgi:hypothetical protein
VSGIVVSGGGWWPPGLGESPDWDYKKCDLHVVSDGKSIDVSIPDENGEQKIGLVSLPISAIARALAEGPA